MQGSDVQTRTEPPKSKQQFHVKKKKKAKVPKQLFGVNENSIEDD